MKFLALAVVLAALSWPSLARADEQTREVQEELRKRQLFYGEIDGQTSPTLSAALKRYQERKHLAVTGAIDDETLKSLGIWSPAPPAEGAGDLPDVAVLRSDARVPGKGSGTAMSAPAPTPQPVALKSSNATRKEVHDFVRAYFAACQSRNIEDELKFYGERVNYYDHGTVDRTYIRNELVVYDQHWPTRDYTVGDSLRLSRHGENAVARWRTAFNVSDPARSRRARGRTNNMLELARRPDSQLEIVSIHESRVRSRSRRTNPVAGAVRRVGGAVRSIFR